MNWYKLSQAVLKDVEITPPDMYDEDNGDDENDWENCRRVIEQYIKENMNKEPFTTIAKQLIENIAINAFKNGIYPNIMLWHEDLDFFSNKAYRTVTLSMNFIASEGTPSSEFESYPYFDLNSVKENWKNLLIPILPKLSEIIARKGCSSVKFLEDNLYDFILGVILNNMCNSKIRETFQIYLENNLNKIEKYVINEISQGELSRYCSPNLLREMSFGEEISGYNLGQKCYSQDSRFDNMEIVFVPQITLSLKIPEEIAEEVISEYGEENELV